MSNALYRAINVVMFPAPFVLSGWTVAAWLIFQRTLGGFFGLFLLIPVVFVQFVLLGVVLWMRPSFRVQHQATREDGIGYFGSLALWAVSVAIPTGWGGVAQVVAALFTAFAISRLWRQNRLEAEAALRERAERARRAAAGPAIQTNDTWNESAPHHANDADAVDAEIIEEPTRRGPEPEQWTATPHDE